MAQNVSATIDVLMPVFGKAGTIRPTLERVIRTFDEDGRHSFRFVVILDGPDESCKEQIQTISDRRISLIELPMNSGKGAALRAACSDLKGDFAVFMDADLDIDPSAALDGLTIMEGNGSSTLACVYGSKVHPNSTVIYPLRRRILSSMFRRYVRFLLKLDVEDTQTGIKVLRTSYLSKVIDRCSERRFLFDVELLTLMAWSGGSFVSTPVKIDYAFDSSIGLKDIAVMGADTMRLAIRMRTRRKKLMEAIHG